MLLTRDPPQNKGHIQIESEGLEKVYHANRDQKKAGVAILISDKIDFIFFFFFLNFFIFFLNFKIFNSYMRSQT